ncbi:MAG: MMPL family transporter [Gammaproteobacteria bacterium]|nr:MMPL family transporter [Gammaproteobacteria bacterium]
MLQTYIKTIHRRYLAVIPLAIITVLLLGAGASRLSFNNDYRVFFEKENPQLQAFEVLQNTYTKNDNVLLVITPEDGVVFSQRTLGAIEEMTTAAWQTPYSIRVDSITNFQHTYAEEDDMMVEDLVLGAASMDQEDLARAQEIAIHEPALRNRLINPDASVTAINITVQIPEIDPATEVPEIVTSVRALVETMAAKYPFLQFHLTGITMMNNAFPEASKWDMQHLMPFFFLALIVVLYLMIRRITGTAVTFVILLLSVIAAMGSAGWMGVQLTPATMAAPTIILTLAIADCVHLLVTWRHLSSEGMEKNQAMMESLRINFLPIFLTSVTTALGFLTLNFSDAPPFHDLGNIAAIGVMYAFVLSITLLPALIFLLPMRAAPLGEHHDSYMAKLAEFVLAHHRKLLWGVGTTVILCALMIPKNELNDNFVQYFDTTIDFRRATDYTVENLTGMYFIDYSLDSGEANGVNNPNFLRQVEQLSDWLRQQPEVMFVSTITDTIKRLNRNMHGDDPAFYRLPENQQLSAQYLLLYEMSLPYGLDLNNQLNVKKSATRISVVMETLTTQQVLAIEDRVYSWMGENTPELLTYGASPTVMFAHIGKTNVKSMLKGTVIALVLISLILIIALRSLKHGLISLVPNLAPAAISFGLWGLFVGEVGMSLAVVTAMTLGIVVDDTIHFMSKYLRARREKGLNEEDAIRFAFVSVGQALVVTTLVLAAGFFILALSAFKLNAGMGLLTAIVILVALYVDFLLLPPLLLKFRQHEKEIPPTTHLPQPE